MGSPPPDFVPLTRADKLLVVGVLALVVAAALAVGFAVVSLFSIWLWN